MTTPSFGSITFFKILQAYKSKNYDQIRQLIKILSFFPLDIPELHLLLSNSQLMQDLLKGFIQFLEEQARNNQYDTQIVNRLLKDLLYPVLGQLNHKQNIKNQIIYERLMTNGKVQLQKKDYQAALLSFKQAYHINQSQSATLYLIIAQSLILYKHSKTNQKIKLNQSQAFLQLLYTKLIDFQVRDPNNVALYERIAHNQLQIIKNKQLLHSLLKISIDLQTKDAKLHLGFVQVCCELHRQNQLYQYVQKVQKYCKVSLEKYYCLGNIYFANKEYEKAEQCLLQGEALIEKNQNNKRLAYMYRNQPQKAEKYANNISHFKQYDKYYCLLGNCLMMQKYGQRTEEAFQFYSRGLRWNNNNPYIVKQIIKYFRDNDKYIAQQMEYLQDGLKNEQNRNDIDYFKYLAQVSKSIGQSQQHKQILQLIDKLFITPLRFSFLAYNYFQMKQLALAQKYCTIMIDIHVDESEAYYILGRILMQSSTLNTARQNFLKSLQYNPKHYQSSFSLALILQKQLKYEDALLQYQRTVEINPNYSKGYQKLCKMCLKLQRKSQVISFATGLITDNQQNYKGYYYLANILFEEQDFTEALNYYNNVLKYEANHYRSNYRIMLIHVILDNRQAAMKHYKQQMAGYRDNYEVVNLMGFMRLKQGETKEAVQLFIESLSSQRTYFEPYYHLGCIISQNDQSTQYWQIQKTIQIKQQTSNELFNYALFYLGLGYFETFIQNFSKALQLCKKELDKNMQTGKKMLNVYMKYMITKFNHLQKFYPEKFYFTIILGLIYRDFGDKQKSQKAFKKIIQERKDSQSLSNFLIAFYNKHLEWHVNSLNCLMFFCQYLIEEALNRSIPEGIIFYEYLAKSKIQIRNQEYTKALLRQKLQQSWIKAADQLEIYQECLYIQFKSQSTGKYQQPTDRTQLKLKLLDFNKNYLRPYTQYLVSNKQIKQKLQVCQVIDQFYQKTLSSLEDDQKMTFEDIADKFLQCGTINIVIYYIYPFVQYDDSIIKLLNIFLTNISLITQQDEPLVEALKKLFPLYLKPDNSTNTHFSSNILFEQSPDLDLYNSSLYEPKTEDENDFYTLNQNYYIAHYDNIIQKRLIKKPTKQIKSMISLQRNKASSVYYYSQILQDNQEDSFFDQLTTNIEKQVQDIGAKANHSSSS